MVKVLGIFILAFGVFESNRAHAQGATYTIIQDGKTYVFTSSTSRPSVIKRAEDNSRRAEDENASGNYEAASEYRQMAEQDVQSLMEQ